MDIILNRITKSYGGNCILEDFSHRFPDGRISCILGPSGCGKTTLLRLVAGLEQPDSGSISGASDAKISMVFQENRLFEGLSARKNVLLTAKPGFTARDAEQLLRSLGISDPGKAAGTCSGGMQRRIAIARALAAEHELLLLDEPLSGLDGDTGHAVLELIRRCCAGKTCLWITHDPAVAEAVGDHILKMPSKT